MILSCDQEIECPRYYFAYHSACSGKGTAVFRGERLSYDEIVEAMKTTLQLAVERK
jgi:hypothetical protein